MKPKDVNSYILSADVNAQETLNKLREIIVSTIPEAEESISYNVPFYKFDGMHVGFAAFKNDATFGIGADVLHEKHRKEFEAKGYKTGKETIQIKYNQQVPVAELKQLLKNKMVRAKNDDKL